MSSLLPLALSMALAPWQTALGRAELERAAAAMPASDVQDIVFFSESRPVLIRFHIQIDGKPFQAAWNDFMKDLFKYLDRDGNGVLTREEGERVPQPQLLFTGNLLNNFGANAAVFRNLDTNRDQKATLQELADFCARSGGGPFNSQPAQTQGPRANELTQMLINRLDTNKDSKLSKEEIAELPASLRKLDLDDDELVTAHELGPNPYLAAGQDIFGRQRQPTVAADNVLIVLASGDTSALVRQLQLRYGNTTRDRRLGREDLGLDEPIFNRLDANKDGKLDTAELAKYPTIPADMEVTIRLGKQDSAASAKERAARQKPGDALLALEIGNSRIELRRNEPSSTRMEPVGRNRDFYVQQFKAADSDGNGYLESKEVTQNPYFRNSFKTMDLDGNGKLYEKEMAAYLDQAQQLQSKALACRTSLTIAEGQGLFGALDTNKDTRLGPRELFKAHQVLASLDRDSDGLISVNDVPRRFELTFGQGGGAFNQGVVAVAAAGYFGMTPKPSASVNGPRWFAKMDRNRDGDLSPREFLGTPEEFRRIDSDADGLIGLDEARRAGDLLKR